jgi:hypothetical protein
MSSDSNETDPQSAAMEVLDASREADPRRCPFGFFSSDPHPWGLGMFHWYPTLDDLFRAIIRDVPAAFIVTGPQAVAEASARIEAAVAGFPDTQRLGAACSQALREALKAVQCLDWIGTFDDLCSSDHDWARELRERFRDGSDTEEEGGGGRSLDRPIAAEEREEFVGFVREYGY